MYNIAPPNTYTAWGTQHSPCKPVRLKVEIHEIHSICEIHMPKY